MATESSSIPPVARVGLLRAITALMYAVVLAFAGMPDARAGDMTVSQPCWRIVDTQGWAPVPSACFAARDDARSAFGPYLGRLEWSVGCRAFTWTYNGRWEPNGANSVVVYGTGTGREACYCNVPGCYDPIVTEDVAHSGSVALDPSASTCGANATLTNSTSEPRCRCNAGYRSDPTGTECWGVLDVSRFKPAPAQCGVAANPGSNPSFGNPIFPLSGARQTTVELARWPGGALMLAFDSRRALPLSDPSVGPSPLPAPSFGPLWESSLHRRLHIQRQGALTVVAVSRGLGDWVTFRQSGGAWVADADVNDRLVARGSDYLYLDAAASAVEVYDRDGRLTSIAAAAGGALSFQYSDAATPAEIAPTTGLLTGVVDAQGRTLQFAYESMTGAPPRVRQLVDPLGQPTTFGYDAVGNLASITWPDGTTRRFVYEDALFPAGLTGIVDERGIRIATYRYDAQRRATLTEGAGGVQRYGAAWVEPPQVRVNETHDLAARVVWIERERTVPTGITVQLPNGEQSVLTARGVHGAPYLDSQSQPAGAGCGVATRTWTRDVNGNPASEDDFNGHRTCRHHDLARNLELARVEGLAAGTACGSTDEGLALPPGSRRIATQWHPDWRLRTRVAEPGRLTTYVYNGQPNPFAGGVIASCAPASAVLPDGKPIAVLCLQVEQATRDADGALGLAALPDPAVPRRERRFTYNALGQPLTQSGPRTDVTQTTVFDYHAVTLMAGSGAAAGGVTAGDLKSVTNAAGHVAQYPRYNAAGQPLQEIDANGIVTTHTYDLRQRPLSRTVGGEATLYEWLPSGPLRRVVSPDGSWVAYEHDDAGRLWQVHDQIGNRLTYTLDPMGQRIAEQVLDPSGVLRRSVARSFDALGRVQQIVGRPW